MKKPCLDCGEPSTSSRCPQHRRQHRAQQVGSPRDRDYDAAWDRLSRRARKLSPFCEVCGSPDDLQLDHLPQAWRRKAAGKVIRLEDVRVLCRLCNVAAGSSRPEKVAGSTDDGRKGLREKPLTPLLTEDGPR